MKTKNNIFASKSKKRARCQRKELIMKKSNVYMSYVLKERNFIFSFFHSIFESCHLTRIRPMDYFSNLFQCDRTLDDVYYHAVILRGILKQKPFINVAHL